MVKKFVFATFISSIIIAGGISTAEAAFDRDLYSGMRNHQGVKELQGFLRDQALYGGPVTGNFFRLTQEAVKKFQEREWIRPMSGYFGPRSRSRANALLEVADPAVSVSVTDLLKKIAELKEKINELQKVPTPPPPAPPPGPEGPPAPPPPPPPTPTPAPVFTKVPFVVKEQFVGTNHSFGARYPYRIVLDWEVDQKTADAVTCDPAIKSMVPVRIGKAELYPDARISYACKVQAGGGTATTSADIAFASPKWISLTGYATSTFPFLETNPLKIGEFSLYNGSSSDVLFSSIETLIYDEMDAPLNRDKRVFFLLRDGKDPTNPIISRKEYTFILTPPKVGDPHRIPFAFPLDIKLSPGGEKTVSMWVELLQYVRSGSLKFDSTKVILTNATAEGGMSLVLTKEPSL